MTRIAREPGAALVPRIARTRLGPVEYAVVGEGHPVLVLHGSPGGIDAAELMSRILPSDVIAAVLVSRPGYLGTELAGRATIDQQADLLAALLDELGLGGAGVLSWSGGGPAGYRLAVRHPELVTSLVAFAAVSRACELPRQGLADRGAEVLADDAARQFALALGPTASPTGRRRAGYLNDLARFATIESLELRSITAPTLIVQGDADSEVEPAHSRYAATTIPYAELVMLAAGTHLALFIHPDAAAVQAQAVQFLLHG